MASKSVKTKNKHAGAAQVDSRRAIEALMAVNESLIAAGSVCRALIQDGRMMGDKEFTARSRRILRLVEGMEDGPNKKLWDDLTKLEDLARANFVSEDAEG